MPTDAQILANQRNAQKSTGPKTQEGKEKCKMNALKHGFTAATFTLSPHEVEDFRQFADNMTRDFAPRNQIELNIVDQIIADSWRLRRAGVFEAEALRAIKDNHPTKSIGEVLYSSPVHERILAGTRAEQQAERAMLRRTRQLLELQERPLPTQEQLEKLPEVVYQAEQQNVADLRDFLASADGTEQVLEALVKKLTTLRDLKVAAAGMIGQYEMWERMLDETTARGTANAELFNHEMWRYRFNLMRICEAITRFRDTGIPQELKFDETEPIEDQSVSSREDPTTFALERAQEWFRANDINPYNQPWQMPSREEVIATLGAPGEPLDLHLNDDEYFEALYEKSMANRTHPPPHFGS